MQEGSKIQLQGLIEKCLSFGVDPYNEKVSSLYCFALIALELDRLNETLEDITSDGLLHVKSYPVT